VGGTCKESEAAVRRAWVLKQVGDSLVFYWAKKLDNLNLNNLQWSITGTMTKTRYLWHRMERGRSKPHYPCS
jgi:hypothetical protein